MKKDKPTHKATVLCARFDPQCGRVVASCSLDGNILITSCYLDSDADQTSGPFGTVTSFGENLLSMSSNAWINSLSFSPSAVKLCYVTHDCEINFVDVSKVVGSKDKPDSTRIMHNGSPHCYVMFTSEDSVMCTGFDKAPYVYK
jgi:WD40 repeat protein